MPQIIFGAALGFLLAQAALIGLRASAGWLQRGEVAARVRALAPAPGAVIIAGLIRYAGVLGAGAALVTLGVWGVGDYLKARSARTETLAVVPDLPATPPASPAADAGTRLAAVSESEEARQDTPDPYADSDFKVRRAAHRPGAPATLKETLLERSEAKARGELLAQVHQHAQRSQYDCEAADRAERYLKAGLDVWGFETWQLKYFPASGYRGATLPQCKLIKSILDPGALDLRSTVAQETHAPRTEARR